MQKSTILLLLVVSGSALAIDIDSHDRIDNPDPGYCAYAALETLGRHHKLKELYGLVDRRRELRFWDDKTNAWIEDGGAYVPEDLGKILDRLEIKYKQQKRGSKDTDILEWASRNNIGCVI